MNPNSDDQGDWSLDFITGPLTIDKTKKRGNRPFFLTVRWRLILVSSFCLFLVFTVAGYFAVPRINGPLTYKKWHTIEYVMFLENQHRKLTQLYEHVDELRSTGNPFEIQQGIHTNQISLKRDLAAARRESTDYPQAKDMVINAILNMMAYLDKVSSQTTQLTSSAETLEGAKATANQGVTSLSEQILWMKKGVGLRDLPETSQ